MMRKCIQLRMYRLHWLMMSVPLRISRHCFHRQQQPFLEQMAEKAAVERRNHFGNSVYLFTPLYIANYCENYCVYCGFNCYNHIHRKKLNMQEIEHEMKVIADSGIEEILMLTGESRHMSDVKYIGEACKLASKYFRNVGLEIYPVNVDEYKYLHECGADYITVFQETYNPDKYETLHLMGHKRVWPYRFEAQERALMGGMRGVGFSALLGLDDFRKDALATALHVYYLQRKYPHAEMSLSCPRLRPIINNDKINPKDVHETQLVSDSLCVSYFPAICGYYSLFKRGGTISVIISSALRQLRFPQVSAPVSVTMRKNIRARRMKLRAVMSSLKLQITAAFRKSMMPSRIRGFSLC